MTAVLTTTELLRIPQSYEELKRNFKPRYQGDTPQTQWVAFRYCQEFGLRSYKALETVVGLALASEKLDHVTIIRSEDGGMRAA